MNIVYVDCIGGASGDMLLGALVEVGVKPETLQGVIHALRLPGCELHFEKVMKGALSATLAVVSTPQNTVLRHPQELCKMIENAHLSQKIKTQAVAILHRLAEVEAGIHHEQVERLHLHELGGDDTLIDIVGVLVGFAELEVTSIVVSPLPLSRGFIPSSHGLLPLPAPATLALLEGVPIRYMDTEVELVTPTGAVLLTTLADSFGGFPSMTLRRVGYGAGKRDLPYPNLLRIWLGEAPSTGEMTVESLVLIETNIDDMNPQVYTYLVDRLFQAGALDVTLTPMQMKKNRPGVLVSLLGYPEKADQLVRILFEETTTLGVRKQMIERICLPRSVETVETRYGAIRVKIAHLPSGVERRTPEYEDCRRAAEAHRVSLMEVIAAVSRG